MLNPGSDVYRMNYQKPEPGAPVKAAVTAKARLGFAIALGALIGVAEAEACKHVALLRLNSSLFCIAVVGAGSFSWLLGQLTERKKAKSDHPLIFLSSLRYWGMILIVSTAGLYSLNMLRRSQPAPVVAQAKASVDFPPLDLEGVVCNGARSSALINGRVLFIGDGIGDVQLVAVDEGHATVALEGQKKVLTLRSKANTGQADGGA